MFYSCVSKEIMSESHHLEAMVFDKEESSVSANQTLQILHEISTILNCHLDFETLAICYRLIENGVNAEALARVIIELRKETQKLQNA